MGGCLLGLWCYSVGAATGGGASMAPLSIVATNYPLAYFAERLGGEQVRVTFPAPPDEDPAFWQPDSRTIAQMQKADLIALNGADYEKWLTRVTLPRSKWVDTSARFKPRYIVIQDAVTHSHGPGGQHSHAGTAFTTWLDFEQAAQQATALAEAMIRRRPELDGAVSARLAALKADLGQLDDAMQALAARLKGLPLLASHPVYQYLARRYGLDLGSVHWEPNEMPPESEWAALKRSLSTRPARLMLWEDTPGQAITTRLEALGLQAAPFLPCANRPGAGDFLSVMRQNIASLAEVSKRVADHRPAGRRKLR